MPESHPLTQCDSVSLTALAQERLIMLPPASLLRRWIDGKFAEVGRAPFVAIESSTMAAACVLASKGLGITIADLFTLNSLDRDGLAVRPLDPPLNATFGYILPTGRRPSPLVLRFIDLVRSAAESVLAPSALAAWYPWIATARFGARDHSAEDSSSYVLHS
jgi:DNA-binding transcriptional LysR family regulator